MPDETVNDLNARRARDIKTIARELTKMGVNPGTAESTSRGAADRLFYGGLKSPTRVLQRGSLGEFMAGDFADPLGALVYELFRGLSDEEKLVAVQRREEAAVEIRKAKIASGQYSEGL